MNIFQIPGEIHHQILNYCDLGSQSKLACTCNYFNRLTNDTTQLAKRLKPADMKVANAKFFKKFFDLFDIVHLVNFNFQLMTRKELSKIDIQDDNAERSKMVKISKLLQSIQKTQMNLEEEFRTTLKDPSLQSSWEEIGQWDLLLKQKPYILFLDIDRHEMYIQSLVDKKEKGQITEEEEIELMDFLSNDTEVELEQQNKCGSLMFLDHFRMDLIDNKLLEKLYTLIWKNYSIQHLDNKPRFFTLENIPKFRPDDKHSFMPASMFQGLCNVIKIGKNNFSSFQSWYLSEKNLQAWNTAFENRKVERLDVILFNDITAESMKKFASIILSLDSESSIEVEYLTRDENSETSKAFMSFEGQIQEKNSKTKWNMFLV